MDVHIKNIRRAITIYRNHWLNERNRLGIQGVRNALSVVLNLHLKNHVSKYIVEKVDEQKFANCFIDFGSSEAIHAKMIAIESYSQIRHLIRNVEIE